jgi:hypothetical protein
MTYNIDYAPAISGWWITLIVFVGVAVIVATIAIVAPGLDDKTRSRRRRIFGWCVLVIGMLISAAASTGWGVIHHQQGVTRVHAVAKAWGLDRGDASYLLVHVANPDHVYEAIVPEDYEAIITLDGKSTKAYLLKQGDSLRLIQHGKPLPVVSR